jgi:hypothetical protein
VVYKVFGRLHAGFLVVVFSRVSFLMQRSFLSEAGRLASEAKGGRETSVEREAINGSSISTLCPDGPTALRGGGVSMQWLRTCKSNCWFDGRRRPIPSTPQYDSPHGPLAHVLERGYGIRGTLGS